MHKGSLKGAFKNIKAATYYREGKEERKKETHTQVYTRTYTLSPTLSTITGRK